MKKKSSYAHRIVALLTVFLMLISCIAGGLRSGITANAWGDADTGDIPSTIGGNTGEYVGWVGSGWRISLLDTGFSISESPLKVGSIFSSPKNQLTTRTVTKSIILSDSGTRSIKSLYSEGGTVYSCENTRVNAISEIFGGISNNGLNLHPLGSGMNDSGDFTESYWRDIFKPYIEANKEVATNQFLSKFGESISSTGINPNTTCFVVEPVIFWYSPSLRLNFAIGWLDIADGNSPSNIFNVGMNSGTKKVCDNLPWILNPEASGTCVKLRAMSRFVNDTTVNGKNVHRDINSYDWNLNGYVVYGADVNLDKPGKASATYTLFYNGDSTESNKSYTTKHSTNIMSSDSAGTIHYNTNDVLAGNVGDLKSWSWHSTVGNSNSPTKAGTTVTHRVTGDSNSDWNLGSGYTNVLAGIQQIQFADINSTSTSNLVVTVNNVASDINSIELTSTPKGVTGGNLNYGKTYSLTLAGGGDLVSHIANKTANSSKLFDNNSASQVQATKKYSGSMKNIATNFALKALDISKNLKSVSSTGLSTNGDSSLGVSVTLMAKKKNINSYYAFASFDREHHSLSFKGNGTKTYDVSSNGVITVPDSMDGICLYIVTKNGNYNLKGGNGYEIFSKARTDISSISGLKDAFVASGRPASNVEYCGFISKGQTINVGTYDGSNGYSVLILQLTGNVTKSSELKLNDYELNYVFPSMLPLMLESDNCSKLIDLETYTGIASHADSDIAIKGTSEYKGSIITMNNSLDKNKNILQYDGKNGRLFTTESKARNGYTFKDNITNVRFSLAVNLVRGQFDDNITVSSISEQTLDKTYAEKNLRLGWGNKSLYDYVNKATELRNSNALIGNTQTDTFAWSVKYVNSIYKNKPASWDGTRVKYVVNEKAYKYQTDTIIPSENENKTVNDSLQSSTSGISSNSSVLTSPYKIAVVNSSSSTLKFFPEVQMRAYSTSGDKIDNLNSVLSHTVKVLGEYLRTLKPSSMYTIKVTPPSSNAITGTTLSDSIAVGSNASDISGNLPVIYAGGNISLNVTTNFKLNMYAYSLDLIEPNDNDIIGTGNYKSVVADGSNIKANWGNNASYKPLDEFNTWIKDTLDNLAVDTTLKVNGDGVNKTFNNFASSVGDLGTSEATADGVYSIKVAKGDIVNNSGYEALINQIALDYSVDKSKAETIFKNSGIYQSIANAVEDCNDSFNASGKAGAIDSSRDHWYDEEVKTFVVRRFKKEDITVNNILVNDKIDYGAAPTADNTSGSNSYKKATAKWYLTLYFKDLPTGFTAGTSVYNPSSYVSLANANSSGTVLVNEVYINGADFIVPSASTSDTLK